MSAALPIDPDRRHEAAFVGLLLVGMTVVALGVAVLIVGLSVGTRPPAPYVSPTDRWALIGASAVAIVLGVALVRLAGRSVGW